MARRIDFYEEVEVLPGARSKKYVGKRGVLMGIAEEDGILYGYSALLYGSQKSVCFGLADLKPTGKKFKREDFYDGSYARVSPEGELLEVVLAKKDPSAVPPTD